MPVRVVVLQAVSEPEDRRDAERVLEAVLDRLPGHPRVAVAVQEALAGRQARAFAVHLDRAAFEHPREAERGEPGRRGDPSRDGVVVGQDVLAAPAVEGERDRRAARARSREKDGCRVAQPDVAERDHEEARPETRERRRGEAAVLVVGHEDVEALAAGPAARVAVRDRGGELHERRLHAGKGAFPEIGVARPREPDGRVVLPLGGLAEAGRAGRRARLQRRRGHPADYRLC